MKDKKNSTEKERKINIPNILTIVRLVLVIPFLALMFTAYFFINKEYQRRYDDIGRILLGSSLFVFMVAMITDFLDGYIARKTNQITEFGKLWDPLADKIMIISALITLSMLKVVPIWLTLLFILRDLIVDGTRVIMAKNNISVAAKWTGKFKTVMQTLGIITVYIFFLIFNIPEFLEEKFTNKTIEFALLHAINSPLIIAGILNIISGFEYFNSIKEYIKLK